VITQKNAEIAAAERQPHSVLASGFVDTKFFQNLEYPLGKQFMRKTIGMWNPQNCRLWMGNWNRFGIIGEEVRRCRGCNL
jgi:hypothetical protein